MKKLILALMMCVALPAMAAGSDGGTEEVKKCDGVVVSPIEAKDFNTNFGVLIIVASQSKAPHELISEDKQLRVVGVLKQLDEVAKGNKTVCVVASPDDVDLVLFAGDTLSKEIERAHNKPLLIDLTLKLAGGSRDKAIVMINHFIAVAQKMMAYVGSNSKTL